MATIFEQFGGDVRDVLVSSQQWAHDLRHIDVGTEHLLLAIAAAETDELAPLSTTLGSALGDLSPRQTFAQLRSALPSGPESRRLQRPGQIPVADEAKAALESSVIEAERRGAALVELEHLVLAILDRGERGTALLRAIGVDTESVRRRVIPMADSEPTSTPDDLTDVAGRPPDDGASLPRRAPAPPIGSVRRLAPAPPDRPSPPTTARSSRPVSTPAVDGVLAFATDLAGDGPVRTSHLLAALAQTDGGLAAEVLAVAGLDRATVDVAVDGRDAAGTADELDVERLERTLVVRPDRSKAVLEIEDPAMVAAIGALARSVEAAGAVPGDPVRLAALVTPDALAELADALVRVGRELSHRAGLTGGCPDHDPGCTPG